MSSNIIGSIIWIIFIFLSLFTHMIIKSLSGEVDFIITLFSRFAYSLPILFFLAYVARKSLLFQVNNWKNIVGDDLFKVCYPKSFKSSNKFAVSTLLIMVKRGHEVDLEYSKKKIMDKMNTFFGYTVVEKIKLTSFDNQKQKPFKKLDPEKDVTNEKYHQKINSVRNDKIKKSLIELTKVFKEK